MDFELARFNMVEQQIRPWNVLDQEVLDALMTVKREAFVAPGQQALAFGEVQLPIGAGQVMLEPKIEGRVLQTVRVKSTDSVLEIGAGSGFMAALLAARAQWVRTLEIEPSLARLAHDNLVRNGVDNVIVEEADGSAGWPERAPYDVIVASGAVEAVPQAWLDQLKVGGRLFVFVGQPPVLKANLITRTGQETYEEKTVFETWVPALRIPAKPGSHFQF
jgi:protein-L-isoaspartate(D-aspartate) O-methyltransferase